METFSRKMTMNPRVYSRILGVFHSHCFWVRYRTHIHTHYAHAQTFIVTGVNPVAELFVQMEPSMGNRFLQNCRVPSFKIHTCSLHADINTYSCSRNTYTHMFKTLCFQQMQYHIYPISVYRVVNLIKLF